MRISDWSSDVCSSDLPHLQRRPLPVFLREREQRQYLDAEIARGADDLADRLDAFAMYRGTQFATRLRPATVAVHDDGDMLRDRRIDHCGRSTRSEEHTSELQSPMRNSYAVFCLNKNKHKT